MNIHGYVEPRFRPVMNLFASHNRGCISSGSALVIYHKGQCIADLWAGVRDNNHNFWKPNTLVMGFSVTKGVLSTLVHILVDRGILEYDVPIVKYWPEFGVNGKSEITLRHILSHEAGLYCVSSLVNHAEQMYDWVFMTKALAQATPIHKPGVKHGYHALTYGWLIGEIIQRTMGKSVEDLVQELIASPLDLEGCFFGYTDALQYRTAKLFMRSGHIMPFQKESALRKALLKSLPFFFQLKKTDFSGFRRAFLPVGIEDIDFNSKTWGSAPIWAANGFFDARSLAKLYAALVSSQYMDIELISQQTLQEATRIHNKGSGEVLPFTMAWRLGYHGISGMKPLPNAFGHVGIGGSAAWADPTRDLAVALVSNRTDLSAFARYFAMTNTVIHCVDKPDQ